MTILNELKFMSLRYRATARDLANEDAVAVEIQEKWQCKLTHLPHLFHVDWMAERNDKLVAFIEFKQRTYKASDKPFVHLNTAKKYKYLSMLSYTAPAFFVVRFADGVTKYINVNHIDDSKRVIAGEYNRWGPGKHDLEEMIVIPLSQMTDL